MLNNDMIVLLFLFLMMDIKPLNLMIKVLSIFTIAVTDLFFCQFNLVSVVHSVDVDV